MSQKKIVIDQKKCIGCNTCPLIAPDTFVMDPSNYKAKVKQQPKSITPTIENAVNSCPVGAISVTDDISS